MSVATNNYSLFVAKQTRRGVYPANPTFRLRVLGGGLTGEITKDVKNVADNSFWTSSLERVGLAALSSEVTVVCEPNSSGLLFMAGGLSTDTPGGGADPYEHVLTAAAGPGNFTYLTFWQCYDGQWTVFHDCQVASFGFAGSTSDKFLALRLSILGLAEEETCAQPTLPGAEEDAYHWLDAGGYWNVLGDAASVDHSDLPEDLDDLKAWLLSFKTLWNGTHCALASGLHHKAADAVNTLTYATPIADQTAANTALDEIKTVLNAHFENVTVHYFADPNVLTYAAVDSLAASLLAVQEIIGQVNTPGRYNAHAGAVGGINNFGFDIATGAKGIQGESLTYYAVHRSKGEFTVIADQLLEDFRLRNLIKFGDPNPAAGTKVSSEIQYGCFEVKFTASTSGNERSIKIIEPRFSFDPAPVLALVGDPEGNEQFLPIRGTAKITPTVKIKNSIPAY